MKIPVELKITQAHLETLYSYLYPGDEYEAVAIALCGRRKGVKHALLVQDIVSVPMNSYKLRSSTTVEWKTEWMIPLLEKAETEHLAILKIHSHPGGHREFSLYDDASDNKLFPSIHGWTDDGLPHASGIMLPDKHLIVRTWYEDGTTAPVEKITVVGDNIDIYGQIYNEFIPEFSIRHAQVFGSKTTSMLKSLTIAVIGCSGTGSLVIEQLARLGVGKLILIDPDVVEEKNLNRIVNSTKKDADNNLLKVDVLKRSIESMQLSTEVITYPINICESQSALLAIAEADIVFGCMDGAEGRFLLNKLSTYYILPYIDVGVRIDADGLGGVDQVCGSVHYLQPHKSSLLSRKAISMEQVNAEAMKRTNPSEYQERIKEGYIHGVRENSPAVISINMLFSSLAVNEFLARIHSFRVDGNTGFAKTCISLTEGLMYTEEEQWPCNLPKTRVGKGDVEPFLGMPSFSIKHTS